MSGQLMDHTCIDRHEHNFFEKSPHEGANTVPFDWPRVIHSLSDG